jgi:membrane-associated phospholipid phosphatase
VPGVHGPPEATLLAAGWAHRHHIGIEHHEGPRLGIPFCLVALSVALATVYGRYHYAADAAAGALVGAVAFAVSSRIHPREGSNANFSPTRGG